MDLNEPPKTPDLTLVLGGARSGKSAYALKLAQKEIKHQGDEPRALFIATATVMDKEMEERVDAHRRERGPMWHSIEEGIGLGQCLSRHAHRFDVAVIDCLTMWASNMLFRCPEKIEELVEGLENALINCKRPVFLVSGEVGLGIVPVNKVARKFRDTLGLINQRFACLATRVIFMAAGIPMVIKGPDS